ncbi:MAG: transposase, partial [Acidobacteria bacterium]|nr:transposase [Acidobacteriota bacterium]
QQNGRHERFHLSLLHDRLDGGVEWDLRTQQRVFERYRLEFNEKRPHSALGNRTPSEYALAIASAALCIAEMGRGGSIATPSSQTHLPASNQRGEVI